MGLMATVLITIVALMGAIALLGPAMTAGLVPFLTVVAGISAILGVMALTLPTILEAAGKFIDQVAPDLVLLIEAIADGISEIIYSIGTVLPPIIESIGTLFTDIFGGIATIIDTVTDDVIKLMNATTDFIAELGPAIDTFVDGVIDAVTKLINFLISGIEYMVNLVVGGINKIIDGVNAVGDYVGFTIDRVPAFELPRFVPKLAKGGIIAKPTQAILGEAGREAVIPLENNTEWMDMLAEKLNGANNNITIRFTGSTAQLVRMLKPELEKEDKRTGKRLIVGGAY